MGIKPSLKITLGLFIVALNLLILYEFNLNKAVLYEEGGFIETIGAFAFLFSSVLLAALSFNKSNFEQRLTLLFATTCLLCFLREVDLEDLNIPYLLKDYGSGKGRNILFSLIYLVILSVIVWKDRTNLFDNIILSFKSPVSITVLLGVIFLIVGNQFEKQNLTFVEEILEMNGALIILFASVFHITIPILCYQSNHPSLHQNSETRSLN